MPPVKNVRECMPIREVRLGSEHRCEEHNVRKGNGHAAAGERVAHVPRVTEEDDALLGVWPTLLDGWEERIRHAPEPVLRQRGVDGRMERFGELRDDVGENMILKEDKTWKFRKSHASAHKGVTVACLLTLRSDGRGFLTSMRIRVSCSPI